MLKIIVTVKEVGEHQVSVENKFKNYKGMTPAEIKVGSIYKQLLDEYTAQLKEEGNQRAKADRA